MDERLIILFIIMRAYDRVIEHTCFIKKIEDRQDVSRDDSKGRARGQIGVKKRRIMAFPNNIRESERTACDRHLHPLSSLTSFTKTTCKNRRNLSYCTTFITITSSRSAFLLRFFTKEVAPLVTFFTGSLIF